MARRPRARERRGILTSSPGPRGGFRLARPLAAILLMDVVAAVEGHEDAFRCAEIRQQGPGAAPQAGDGTGEGQGRNQGPECAIAHAMGRAELAWRQALAAQNLDDIRQQAERQAPEAAERLRSWLAEQ
ncbi:RrF2 family transcriptional regulator [Streptomyces sp. NPDC059447]|uniref:RrF2 family transcriptional regulator n=1 Tax=Streptomyces sp. NPDC059447 TaxID=3346834 RepID=UPI0036CBA5C2